MSGTTSSETVSSASVPTAHASRYLQQLCKHWSHRMTVEFTPERGRIEFPNGSVARLEAEEDALAIALSVPAGGDVGRMRQVVAEHLDRFAFREAPLAFDWRDA